MKEMRFINGEKYVKVYAYQAYTATGDYVLHLFYAWDAMYDFHEKEGKSLSDKWIYKTTCEWEKVAHIEKLQVKGYVIVHNDEKEVTK